VRLKKDVGCPRVFLVPVTVSDLLPLMIYYLERPSRNVYHWADLQVQDFLAQIYQAMIVQTFEFLGSPRIESNKSQGAGRLLAQAARITWRGPSGLGKTHVGGSLNRSRPADWRNTNHFVWLERWVACLQFSSDSSFLIVHDVRPLDTSSLLRIL
jgi:hypothetical protein